MDLVLAQELTLLPKLVLRCAQDGEMFVLLGDTFGFESS
jgi:hypothetical protein